MAQDACQSPLLRCLAQLDGDSWAQVLLPLLQQQGSAPAVALTCQTLRALCHSNVQNLDLSSLHDSSDTDQLEDALRSLPGHFSSCKTVQLLLEAEDSYHIMPYLLPSIASLPSLRSLEVTVEGTLHALPMSTVLYSLRSQLSGLQSLDLDLKQSWAGASAVWRELGRLTQLTALHMMVQGEFPPAADLHKLSDLGNLQSLRVTPKGRLGLLPQPLPLAPMLSGLTALTEFVFIACLVGSISDVGGCTALKRLVLGCPYGQEAELGDREWDSLAQLTRLTNLQLCNAELLSATPPCMAALSKLVCLEVLGAERLHADMLPALAAISQLTCIGGAWLDGGLTGCIQLPSVRALRLTSGSPPFQALPGLELVESGMLAVPAILSLSRHCMGLTALACSSSARPRLPGDAPGADRIAALQSLTRIHALTSIKIMGGDGNEFISVVHAASILLSHNLQKVELLANMSWVPVGALMHVGKLAGLKQLVLHLLGRNLSSKLQSDLGPLLSVVSGIGEVCIGLSCQQDALALREELQNVKAIGLPCPRQVTILVAGLDCRG